MPTRHFLTLRDLLPEELASLVDRAIALKRDPKSGREIMRNKTLALIFDKSSTRTRVSFETAVTQLGGNTIFLPPGDSQLGRGEPVEDTARVLSSMVDVVVIRTAAHDMVETFARFSTVPVINGLTDCFHPCQLLADVQTYVEMRGTISGTKVAWVGDGNNVCQSWMNAACLFDFELNVATPKDYRPDDSVTALCESNVRIIEDPRAAAAAADILVTDTWASMGHEKEKQKRSEAFKSYQVDTEMMRLASDDVLFMHCLPAYRGCEVTAEVIDGPRSVVWRQAENRLYAQKALLEFLLGPAAGRSQQARS
ncbi:MAG: ornithine carbamoyltransferase [Gammaproteobacteria bacterium]|nr:ornithine carbamoyltransferase [Gammaproteobacteria bacterium]